MKQAHIIFFVAFTAICIIGCANKGNVPESNSMIEGLKNMPDSVMTNITTDSYIKFYDTLNMADSLSGFFLIKNIGKKNLSISDIKTGCSCVEIVTNFKNVVIHPNESTKLEFHISSFSSPGYFSKPITLIGNFYPYYRRFLVECYVQKGN